MDDIVKFVFMKVFKWKVLKFPVPYEPVDSDESFEGFNVKLSAVGPDTEGWIHNK